MQTSAPQIAKTNHVALTTAPASNHGQKTTQPSGGLLMQLAGVWGNSAPPKAIRTTNSKIAKITREAYAMAQTSATVATVGQVMTR